MKKRIVVWLCLVLVLILSISGCSKAQESNVIKIGLFGPMTGGQAAQGAYIKNAATMAMEEINAAGGIAGKYKIELHIEDDENDATKGATVVQKLINQTEVDILVGPIASSVAFAVMDINEEAKIPLISPAASNQGLVERGNQFFFRNAAADNLQSREAITYGKDVLGAQKVAVFHEASDYGQGGGLSGAEAAQELGLEVTTIETYVAGDTDFSVQLMNIQATDPDLILLWGNYAEGALILQQMRQYEIDIPIIGGTGYASAQLVELGGDAVDGMMFTTPFIYTNPAENIQEFSNKYIEKYEIYPDMAAAQAYDVMYIIASAVEQADSLEGEKLAEALHNLTPYNGVSGGPISFDARGEVMKSVSIVQIQNGGEYVVLK